MTIITNLHPLILLATSEAYPRTFLLDLADLLQDTAPLMPLRIVQ